jgi:hypothetical protein
MSLPELHSFDISKVNRETFEAFIASYKKNQEKLCVYKDKVILRLTRELLDNYDLAKKVNMHDTLYYISRQNVDDYDVLAFALLREETPDKIITLEYLCSHIDKSLKLNDKPLGVYLLNHIYYKYVLQKSYILKIQPATDELIPIYRRWKEPSLPMFTFERVMTSGYLIYGDKSDIKENATDIFIDFKLIDAVKEHLNITDEELNDIPNNNLKREYLISKLEENTTLSDSHRQQLASMISHIHIFSLDDVDKFFVAGGSKSRNVYKKRRRKGVKRCSKKRRR